MHLQRTQTRSIIEEDWGAVERLERAVVLHVELPEIQARGQLNPEVVCGLSRSQRQVGDNFESLDEPTSTKNLPAASLYFAERLRMFSSSLLSPGRPNASA